MRLSGFKTVALAAFLVVTASACEGGADARGSEDTLTQGREVSGLNITADTVRNLAPGTYLRLDGTAQEDVLLFDPSRGAIDYSRIALVAGGQEVAMDRWLEEAALTKGVDTAELLKSVLAVKLSEQDASLASWTSSGTSQQGVCPDCCTAGHCCLYTSDCTYYPSSGTIYCVCSVWGCCENPTNPPVH